MTSEEVGNSHGYQCPRCKRGDNLSIASRVWADLTPDGAEVVGDIEWDVNSDALCHTSVDVRDSCGWAGKVSDLLTVEVTQ
jgi:hypothetical protein